MSLLKKAGSTVMEYFEWDLPKVLSQGQAELFKYVLKRVPISIATWRSRMVCLSLSAGIPGLELPDTFMKGLLLSPTFSLLGTSLLCANHTQCLVHQ